ncbi:hypothetical protein PO909_000281 [Leuciscus waleckii]
MEDLEVEWRRPESETLVHLYEGGESRPEAQQQDYQDRANFFTEEIKHGNFSLRLDNLRAEDKGEYTCTVHTQKESGETEVQIKHVERLLVSGSDRSISASVGEDVTLNCSVDSHITPEDFEQVSWKKTDEDDEDEDILVLLYQNNETFPDSSDERYRGRVEFFTAEIPKGNFSVRLKSVRTEDKGVYMCEVFAGRDSANSTVVLEQLGFSALHIIMLILCISASGSALLLCCLIYCRSQNHAMHLQASLVICPNLFLFIAFVLWGVTEGSLDETVACCALYFLRPLMLFSAVPNNKGDSDLLIIEYFLFSTVVYSVLFKKAWEKSLNFSEFDRMMTVVLLVIMLLPWLFFIIDVLASFMGKLGKRISVILEVLLNLSLDILPSLQFILLFYALGSASGGFIIVAVLPLLTTVTRYNWDTTCGAEIGCSPLVRRSVWIMLMLFMNAVMVYFYIMALEKEKDGAGWACVIGFLQLLWTVWIFHRSFDDTVNGKGVIGDLRIVVFPSECLCLLLLLISLVSAPWIQTPDTGSEQNQSPQTEAGSGEPPATGSDHNSESHVMKALMENEDQETGSSGETQPDSVVTHT